MLAMAMYSAFAGPKEDFIKEVKSQCNKSDAEADSLATPGRSGNIIKLQVCNGGAVDLGDSCKIKCKSTSGNVVGE